MLYCSGDLHAGNVTRAYKDSKGEPVVQVGFENTLSALEWAKDNTDSKLASLVVRCEYALSAKRTDRLIAIAAIATQAEPLPPLPPPSLPPSRTQKHHSPPQLLPTLASQVSGCSAGSLGTQIWAEYILKTFDSKESAVVSDSYAGVFPDGTQGPLVYEYVIRALWFNSDATFQPSQTRPPRCNPEYATLPPQQLQHVWCARIHRLRRRAQIGMHG